MIVEQSRPGVRSGAISGLVKCTILIRASERRIVIASLITQLTYIILHVVRKHDYRNSQLHPRWNWCHHQCCLVSALRQIIVQHV